MAYKLANTGSELDRETNFDIKSRPTKGVDGIANRNSVLLSLESVKKLVFYEEWDFEGETLDFTSYPDVSIEFVYGGFFKDVTLICNNTTIVPSSEKIFEDVTFSGTPKAEYITPEMFGAVGDAVVEVFTLISGTDDGEAIQQAAELVSLVGNTWYKQIPGKTYYSSRYISFSGNTKIDCSGSKNAFSEVVDTNTNPYDYAITISNGTYDYQYTQSFRFMWDSMTKMDGVVSEDIISGSLQFKMDDATGISIGDMIHIESTDETAVGSNRGENCVVTDVFDGVVTVERPIEDYYNAADYTVTIYVMKAHTSHIKGLHLIALGDGGTDLSGIRVCASLNCLYENITLENFAYRGLELFHSYNTTVRNLSTRFGLGRNLQYGGYNFYPSAAHNFLLLDGFRCTHSRHCADYGNGYGFDGAKGLMWSTKYKNLDIEGSRIFDRSMISNHEGTMDLEIYNSRFSIARHQVLGEEWVAGTYNAGDTVLYANGTDLNLYICLSTTSEEPSNSTYWRIVWADTIYNSTEWTDSLTTVIGEYYRYDNELYKALTSTTAVTPIDGSDYELVVPGGVTAINVRGGVERLNIHDCICEDMILFFAVGEYHGDIIVKDIVCRNVQSCVDLGTVQDTQSYRSIVLDGFTLYDSGLLRGNSTGIYSLQDQLIISNANLHNSTIQDRRYGSYSINLGSNVTKLVLNNINRYDFDVFEQGAFNDNFNFNNLEDTNVDVIMNNCHCFNYNRPLISINSRLYPINVRLVLNGCTWTANSSEMENLAQNTIVLRNGTYDVKIANCDLGDYDNLWFKANVIYPVSSYNGIINDVIILNSRIRNRRDLVYSDYYTRILSIGNELSESSLFYGGSSLHHDVDWYVAGNFDDANAPCEVKGGALPEGRLSAYYGSKFIKEPSIEGGDSSEGVYVKLSSGYGNTGWVEVGKDEIIAIPQSTTTLNESHVQSLIDTYHGRKIIFQDDFDFGGGNLNFSGATGSGIEFRGGSLQNVTINGDSTIVVPSESQIFDGVTFTGTFRCEFIVPEMFGIVENVVPDQTYWDSLGLFQQLSRSKVKLFGDYITSDYIVFDDVVIEANGSIKVDVPEYDGTNDADIQAGALFFSKNRNTTYGSNSISPNTTKIANSTEDIPANSYQVNLDASPSLEKGDSIIITTSDGSDNAEFVGEQCVVESCRGSVVTLSNPTRQTYLTGATAYGISVYKLESVTVDISGKLKIYTDTDLTLVTAIQIVNSKDSLIFGIHIDRCHARGIMLHNSLNTLIDNVIVSNCFGENDAYGYALLPYGACLNTTVRNHTSYMNRHDADYGFKLGRQFNFVFQNCVFYDNPLYGASTIGNHDGTGEIFVRDCMFIAPDYVRVDPTDSFVVGDYATDYIQKDWGKFHRYYISNIDNNTSDQFDRAAWDVLVGDFAYTYTTYDSGTTYNDGDRVIFNGERYVANATVVGEDPDTSSSFDKFITLNSVGIALRTNVLKAEISNCTFINYNQAIAIEDDTERFMIKGCKFFNVRTVILFDVTTSSLTEFVVEDLELHNSGLLSNSVEFTTGLAELRFSNLKLYNESLLTSKTDYDQKFPNVKMVVIDGLVLSGYDDPNIAPNYIDSGFGPSFTTTNDIEVVISNVRVINFNHSIIYLFGNNSAFVRLSVDGVYVNSDDLVNVGWGLFAMKGCPDSEFYFSNASLLDLSGHTFLIGGQTSSFSTNHLIASLVNCPRILGGTSIFRGNSINSLVTGVFNSLITITTGTLTDWYVDNAISSKSKVKVISTSDPESRLNGVENSECLYSGNEYIKTSSYGTLTGWVLRPKNDFAASAAPTVTDDSSDGWGVGSMWYYSGTLYTLVDNTEGAAVWV